MKGQSPLIGYIVTILFSMFVLASISYLVYSFYRNALEREVRSELTQIATQVKDSLIKIYDTGKQSDIRPSNSTTVLISETDLNLPASVAKLNYEVYIITQDPVYAYITNATINNVNISGAKEASVAKIVARTTQDPIVELGFDLPNLGIVMQGRVENGLSDVLKYYRYNENATMYDTVIFGPPDIIIRITGISG